MTRPALYNKPRQVFIVQKIAYDREAAVRYATRWALDRNPKFFDFSNFGGDCSAFCSQCLFAGTGVMNYTPVTGWYYLDGNRKAPAWTSVHYLHRFLTTNLSVGPYAREGARDEIAPGDLIQLGHSTDQFYHSLFVLTVTPEDILIAAHTNDSYMRPLSSYIYDHARYLKILGARG